MLRLILIASLLFYNVVVIRAEYWSLPKIFANAIEKVEGLSAQKVLVDSSEASLKQAEAAFYPNINFLFNYTRLANPSTSNSALAPLVTPDQFLTKFTAGFTGIQGFREAAAYRGAKDSLQSQRAIFLQSKKLLYLQIAQSYYAVLSARQDLKNLESLRNISIDRGLEIQKWFNIGRVKKTDLLNQETQIASLKAQVFQAEQLLKQNEHSLRIMANLDGNAQIADDLAPLPKHLEVREYFLEQVEKRPDFISLKAQLKAAQEAVLVARAGHFPTLNLNADLYPYRTGANQNQHWDLALSVNFPLFQGFYVTEQEKIAQAQKRNTYYNWLQAKRDGEREIQTYYDQLHSALESIPLYEKAKEQAHSAYLQQQHDYQNKQATILDVNLALNQLYQIIRTQDQLKYQAMLANANLYAATGNVL